MPRRSSRIRRANGEVYHLPTLPSSSSSHPTSVRARRSLRLRKNIASEKRVISSSSESESSESESSDSDSSSDSDMDEGVPHNLFETKLTRAQKAKIQANISKQQDMLRAYEAREKSRTINDIVEMMQCTEEEAVTALKKSKGNFDKAISKLINLKRKQQAAARRMEMGTSHSQRTVSEPVSLPEDAIVTVSSSRRSSTSSGASLEAGTQKRNARAKEIVAKPASSKARVIIRRSLVSRR